MRELILEANQACPHGASCAYNKNSECRGAANNRPHIFTCNLVATREEGGAGYRNPLDETGKMQVIMD